MARTKRLQVRDTVEVIGYSPGNYDYDYRGETGILIADDESSIPYKVVMDRTGNIQWFYPQDVARVVVKPATPVVPISAEFMKFQTYVNENCTHHDYAHDFMDIVIGIGRDVFGVKIEPAAAFSFTPFTN